MSGWAGGIDWPVKPHHGCHELDACDVPWWIAALFVAWMVGPAVVYGITAFVGMGRRWRPATWIAVFAGLLLATCGCYFSWFAYRAFF